MSDVAIKRPPAGMPKQVLFGAAALIALTVIGATTARLTGVGKTPELSARAVQTLSLRFDDQANGSVLVRRASDQAVIYTIAPETNGFMRATLRGLAQERRRSGIDDTTPFLLTRWSDGRMSLDDVNDRSECGSRCLRGNKLGRLCQTLCLRRAEMSLLPALRRQTFESPCTVEIERSAETLEAHVVIDGDYDLRPGDEVLVRDPPTNSPFGERIVVRRMATITRAGLPERIWTRLAGNFELGELYDVSFTERRRL